MEEREEGELSEGELSDISSEEEYLLRQRLQVLESYNNVLERKDQRRRSAASLSKDFRGDKKNEACQGLLPDLSEISGSDLENSIILNIGRNKEPKRAHKKQLSKPTKRKNRHKKHNKLTKVKVNTKKERASKVTSKKESVKHSNERSHNEKRGKAAESRIVPDSSDDTDYEYRNKRRRLQHSVQISNPKTDSSTLKMRLMNMFTDKTNSLPDDSNEFPCKDNEQTLFHKCQDVVDSNVECRSIKEVETHIAPLVMTSDELPAKNDSGCQKSIYHDSASEEDLDLLRQIALKTKLPKPSTNESEPVDHISDSDDSHELRMICLKSTLLKKAIEMKQKKKLRKRIYTMSSIDDILARKLEENMSDTEDAGEHNNTDIESVDMEIGVSDSPDTDDVFKDDKSVLKATDVQGCKEEPEPPSEKKELYIMENQSQNEGRHSVQSNGSNNTDRNEDLDEDEDLLRTKLLTSLSRNLCKTDVSSIRHKIENNTKNTEKNKNETTSNKDMQPETKKFIIKIGNSDSGSDNEATKNLTKMHMKLSENVDFQQKLDLFLKTARKETENKTLPNSTEQLTPKLPSSPEKFVPKAVNHLPKSRQIEYKRLVKRMAELERLKRIRQASLNNISNNTIEKDMKTTFKGTEIVHKPSPTVSVETKIHTRPTPDLETQIALSRKRIAAESAKMLRLKEESSQLVQRHRILAADLRAVRSAMFTNRRDERAVQASLANMRNQHQLLLKRSKMSASKIVNTAISGNTFKNTALSKSNEYNKSKNIFQNLNALQTIKVSVVNDCKEKKKIPELSIKLDSSNNKKSVELSKEVCPSRELSVEVNNEKLESEKSVTDEKLQKLSKTFCNDNSHSESTESRLRMNPTENEFASKTVPEVQNNVKCIMDGLDDYKSPLTSMKLSVSLEDPHGILCPFEVWGSCKDSGCKYLHPKVKP